MQRNQLLSIDHDLEAATLKNPEDTPFIQKVNTARAAYHKLHYELDKIALEWRNAIWREIVFDFRKHACYDLMLRSCFPEGQDLTRTKEVWDDKKGVIQEMVGQLAFELIKAVQP
jgi:hypothetical protein